MATRPSTAGTRASQELLDVTFIDHMRPAATAGTYTIEVEHVLKEGTTPVDGSAPLPCAHEEFEIRAPQFMLDGATVQAVYPARGASGDFRHVLPHITLTRAYLPWEREPKWSLAQRRAPWLTLMLFRAGELPDDPEALALTTERTVRELRADDEETVLGPELTGLDDPALAGNCRTIDVPAAVFEAVLPREQELYYLAHVRDVDEPKLLADGEVLTKGTFSVVTANRFPRGEGDHVAHLVSLEGFDKHLGGTLPGGIRHVRLVTLWSWSFRNDPAAAFDGAGILANLVAPGDTDAENLALRMPRPANAPGTPSAEEAYALERLRLGYVPVPHRPLTGEHTYAWYRGPFTPLTAQDVPDLDTSNAHTTADFALVYDQTYGVFDVSYAAAWTLGRTVALADPSYGKEMTRARRELANTAVRMMAVANDPVRSAAGVSSADGTRFGLGALARLAAHRGGRTLADALGAPQLPQEAVPEPTPFARLSRADARASLDEDGRAATLLSVARHRAGALADRLDELRALRSVPFSYLVPDFRMLPEESLRLFRVDPVWIDTLLAGARDVAVHTSLDQRCDRSLRAATLSGDRSGYPAAGLLMRSGLVPAWPDMAVVARKGTRQLTEIRRELVASDMLLCLFDDVPDRVLIREPSEGIHFGVDTDAAGREVIGLRQLQTGQDPPLGATLPGEYFPAGSDSVFSLYLRPPQEGGVADVLRLEGDDGLVKRLAQAHSLSDLHPAQLAVQLVNAPLEQRLMPGQDS
ncbi:hypothetical protein [Streptomyces monomycini]|uniref:hypothetical protein n=1 Tax=Streptomyces monomycini TaxID=371720 RepID=UPI00067DD947|nr:hypothetical protein [Streptomyces monomycini]